MPWYRVELKQMQPVEVWADNKRWALEQAFEESEWYDYYEIIGYADNEEIIEGD